ncbi:Hect ubiquitin ligase, partial [Globisporangium polare]
EAAAGYRACSRCEFENFTRYAYCSRCGEKLPVSDGEEEGLSDSHKTVTGPKALTATQLRVRKRKEWVRKMDVDGKLFWYRSCVDSGAGGVVESQQPGYVAVFHREDSKPTDTPETDAPATIDEERPGLEQFVLQDSNEVVITLERATEVEPTGEPETPTVNEGESPGLDQTVRDDEGVVIPLDTTIGADAALDTSFKMEIVAVNQVEDLAASFQFPHLSASEKQELFELASRDFPSKYAHFVVTSSALIQSQELIKLSLHRDFVLEQSIESLACVEEKHMRLFMRVNFLSESGVDAGGVHREWFIQVNELLLTPQLRVFVCTNKSEQSYYLNPNSASDIGEEDHLAYYFVTGRLIGRALLEGTVWGFHLALPLIKIILEIPVTFSDLEYLDPEVYRNLVWIRENDGVEHLGLDFSVTEKRGDEIVTVDLIPNGRDIDVTDTNKLEYLERRFQYVVFESVSSQLAMLLKGVHEVIPPELLMIFDAEEFDYLLCGTQEIDVDDWKKHSQYSRNLQWLPVLTWFWEVVREMPNEYRRRLLMFATGSSRVPLGGFAELTSYDGRLCPFTLKGVSFYTTQYISSHACFNRLDLPLYRTKKELRTVLMAILDTESYGFTTA